MDAGVDDFEQVLVEELEPAGDFAVRLKSSCFPPKLWSWH
jgi:hypothetical protein